MLIPVLLAGGAGNRLWPLSRESRPKQFLSLTGASSLLEQSLARVADLPDRSEPVIVGHADHRFVMAEQMRAAGFTGRILLEPTARNTAPAVAAAALDAKFRYGGDVDLLVMPTDHAIADTHAFARAVDAARARAAQGQLTLFGVVPDRPETGYGYIRAGAPVGDGPARRVREFVEKPDADRAADYLAAGDYYWNSGLFVFSAQDYLDALAEHAPDMLAAVSRAHARAVADIDFLRLDEDAFAACPAQSIDYAVMERTDQAIMVPLDAGWNDLGSWSAIGRAVGTEASGNSTRGDVWLDDAENCLVHSDSRLVAVLGTQDLLVVETAEAVLVAERAREQQIKRLVADLRAAGRPEATDYRKTYRPWGSYEQIAAGGRFQVKHIRVTPGGRLSLQKHHHRAEHWIVVHGTARVTCDGRESLLTENQSTFIPLGAVHRLENPGMVDLDLIEVQSGSYLGEDDIVRFDDVYGRADTEPAPDSNVDSAGADRREPSSKE